MGTPADPDLIGMLRKSPGVVTEVLEPLGNVALLRFNHQAAPFDNPAVRRALRPVIAQVDYMTATCGDDREAWRDGVRFLAPGTEFASDADLDKLTRPRDLGAAQAALASSGENGERVVILSPADYPVYKQMSDVSADLLRRIGFNVDLQSMDWATLLRCRVKPDPVSAGGWSIFHTSGTPECRPLAPGPGAHAPAKVLRDCPRRRYRRSPRPPSNCSSSIRPHTAMIRRR